MNGEKLVKENSQFPGQEGKSWIKTNPLWPENKKIKKTKFPGFIQVKLSEGINRRRMKGEVMTLRNAIRANCSECMGFQPSLIEGCTARECNLFPHRLNMTPQSALKRGHDVL